MCEKFVFIKEKLLGEHIFKVPEFPRAYIFVSDEFKKTVEEAELTGFIFEEVLESEE